MLHPVPLWDGNIVPHCSGVKVGEFIYSLLPQLTKTFLQNKIVAEYHNTSYAVINLVILSLGLEVEDIHSKPREHVSSSYKPRCCSRSDSC